MKTDSFRLKKIEMYIILIISAILIQVCVALFFVGSNSSEAIGQIYYDGEVIFQFDLDKDEIFTLPAIPFITFEIKNGTVGFIQSNCADQICIQYGYLNRPGQSAACLPNKTILSVTSQDLMELDLTVY